MENKTIKYILEELNTGKCRYKYYSKKISMFVEFTKIFISETQSQIFLPMDSSYYKMYFILNDVGKYVGSVLDMSHDLHWYILPEERRNGYLSINLNKTILPHLSQYRKYQEITINPFDMDVNSDDSKRIALSAGFKYKGKDNRGKLIYMKDLTKLTWNNFEDKGIIFQKNDIETIQKKVFHIKELMTKISVEVEMMFGECDFVEDMECYINKMTDKIPELEDLFDEYTININN